MNSHHTEFRQPIHDYGYAVQDSLSARMSSVALMKRYADPDPIEDTAPQSELFEALARYLTYGPGTSSVSNKTVADIIDKYSAKNDQEYLRSIILPDYDRAFRVWDHCMESSGHILASITELSVDFQIKPVSGAEDTTSSNAWKFNGQASGLFKNGQFLPVEGAFHYDGDIADRASSTFTICFDETAWEIVIKFFDEVSVNPGKYWAELVIRLYRTSLAEKLILPAEINGRGGWTIAPV